MKIKNIIVLGLIITSIGCTRVPPGYVGIKVDQWGSQKGVQDFPIKTGLVWYNPIKEDIYKFPTFIQNAVWERASTRQSPGDESVTFNSSEGAVVNADLAIAYTFVAEKVPQIFVDFRQEADVITHGFLRNELNNHFNRSASTMKAAEIFGEKKQILLENVRSNINLALADRGFRFEMISFHGALRVDHEVQSRINAVLSASQRALEAEAKVAQSKAEADQLIAKAKGEKDAAIAKAQGEAESTTVKAMAQAKANRLLSESLTPALVQYEALQRWNGILPYVNGGGMPFINIGTNR